MRSSLLGAARATRNTRVKSPSASSPTSWEGTATKGRDPTDAVSVRELGGFVHQGPAPPRDDFAHVQYEWFAESSIVRMECRTIGAQLCSCAGEDAD